ncbi:hypothetical protein W822_19965 [Advenella kashmirensis W13003]|uniref:Uncharacterized protein n=1 Tax=Advenella kashmirensis W13003 TaxID=1424334 RepID=V8QNN3_9BURK|nr:pyocin knob domain-containing protein [Advenella kashmirensis]ETF00930.1 hypothetical protein W822_19965 [Advenella kashmirensis W13003]
MAIPTPADFDRAAINLQKTNEFTNSTNQTFVDINGLTKKTLYGAMLEVTSSQSIGVTTLPELLAITPDGAHAMSRVTEGPDKGLYLWDGAWVKTDDPLDKFGRFVIPQALPSSTDLNNIKTAGVYYSNSNSVVASWLNCPISVACVVDVTVGDPSGTDETSFVYQTITSYTGNSSYRRTLYNGVWGEWLKDASITDVTATATTTLESAKNYTDERVAVIEPFVLPQALPSNTDLNNIKTAGTYYSRSSSTVATWLNCPISVACVIEVHVGSITGSDESTFVYQTITSYTGNSSYRRALYNNNWSAWIKDATISDVTSSATATLSSAKQYTDEREAAIRDDMAAGEGDTLAAANQYTASREASIRTDYAVADAATLSSSKSYTDGKDSVVRTDMAAGDAATLGSANQYTATRETAIRSDTATADAANLNAAKQYTDEALGVIEPFVIPQALPTATDLNNIKTAGVYYSNSNATVATWLNCPISVACIVKVDVADPAGVEESSFVYQTVTSYTGNSSYRRTLYLDSWSIWIKDATTVDVSSGDSQAVISSNSYTDARETSIRDDFNAADAAALSSANSYTDAREIDIRADYTSADATTLADSKTYTDEKTSGIPAVDSRVTAIESFVIPKVILENADFNEYKTSGTYFTNVAAVANTLINSPVNQPGILKVNVGSSSGVGASSYVYQEYTPFVRTSANRSYKRTLYQDIWGEWIKQATEADIQEANAYADSADLAVKALGSLLRNQGAAFPNKIIARNSIVSGANTFLSDAILSIKVIGDRPGKYYGIRYFRNGSTAGIFSSNPYPDAWQIVEYDAENYETTSPTGLDVIKLLSNTTPVPTIPRSGVQTVVIESDVVAGLKFIITLDTSKLPAASAFSHIAMNGTGSSGYSWIIDPANYSYKPTEEYPTVAQVDAKDAATLVSANEYTDSKIPVPTAMRMPNNVFYTKDANGALTVAWKDTDKMYRYRFGINNFNELPNFYGADTAPLGDIETATWTQINNTLSDYLPPMVIEAVNDGDGQHDGNFFWFTGGNHGSTNSASGDKTARNVLYKLLVDGASLPDGAVSGYATSVTALISNELMARNTITVSRYVLRQNFKVDFVAGGARVHGKIVKLEDVNVYRDYGLQMVGSGFNDTVLILDSQIATRKAYSVNDTSGASSAYPNAWAMILKGANGQAALWMDSAVGTKNFASAEPRFRGSSTEGNSKVYAGVVVNGTTPTVLNDENPSYEFKGGYAIGSDITSATFDSVLSHSVAGESAHTMVVSGDDYITV